MTRELWSLLDVNKRENHITIAELLLQLHGLSLPDTASIGYFQDLSVVEKEILKCLTSSNLPYSSSLSTENRQVRALYSFCVL